MGKETLSLWLRSLALLLVICGQAAGQSKVVFCYYTNWAQYRVNRKYFPNNINVNYCSHLVFAFAKLSGNQLQPFEWNDQSRLYPEFNALKQTKPGLKTLLAVGGYNLGGAVFSAMAATASNRAQFVSTTITYLRTYGFDGLDLDWEYPANAGQGGRPEDKQNFVYLIQDLKSGFEREATTTGRERLMLTAAVGVGYETVRNGYDIPALSQYLDYIGLMTYDMHGSWDPRTGHNAALYTARSDPDNFSVSQTAENWALNGASRAKLLVGLATYGHTFRLTNPANTAVGAPASGGGNPGRDSQTSGTLFYYEICEQALSAGYTRVFDQESKVPYLYKGDQWVTYDDVNSLQYKMTWLRQNGYAGAIVWTTDEDDFSGQSCGQGPYPLMSAISRCLLNGVSCEPTDGGALPATTPAPTTTTTTPSPVITTRPPGQITAVPTTRSPVFPTRAPVVTLPPSTGGQFQCPSDGFHSDPRDCSFFYICFGNRSWRFACPPGTQFNQTERVCSYNSRCPNMPAGR